MGSGPSLRGEKAPGWSGGVDSVTMYGYLRARVCILGCGGVLSKLKAKDSRALS